MLDTHAALVSLSIIDNGRRLDALRANEATLRAMRATARDALVRANDDAAIMVAGMVRDARRARRTLQAALMPLGAGWYRVKRAERGE